MKAQLCVVCLVLAGCRVVSCWLFSMGATETTCITRDVAEHIKVVGNYMAQLNQGNLSAPQSLRMIVEVKDPDKMVILSRQYGSEGRFTFTSHTPGEHQICLRSNSSSFAPSSEAVLQVHLDIQVETKVSIKEKLTELWIGVLLLRKRAIVTQRELPKVKQMSCAYRERHLQILEKHIRSVKSALLYALIAFVGFYLSHRRRFQ